MWVKHTVIIKDEYIKCGKCNRTFIRIHAAPGKGHIVLDFPMFHYTTWQQYPAAKRRP